MSSAFAEDENGRKNGAKRRPAERLAAPFSCSLSLLPLPSALPLSPHPFQSRCALSFSIIMSLTS